MGPIVAMLATRCSSRNCATSASVKVIELRWFSPIADATRRVAPIRWQAAPMIKVGLQIPNFTYPGVPVGELFERVAEVAVAAEEAGADTVMVMDHFYQLAMLGPVEHEMMEAYTLLGAIAARTSRVKLGTLVTGVTYRNPAILAKIVTTLDVISSGRAFLGIGAAWFEEEHHALGVTSRR